MAVPAAVAGSRSEVPREARSQVNEITQDWIRIVRGEYLEIPGMLLTRSQVQRLWGFDAGLGDTVLEALLEAGFLERTPGGAFVRVERRSPRGRHVRDPRGRASVTS